RAGEAVLLPGVRRVAPREPRLAGDRQAAQARVVLVGDRRPLGLRDRLHPDETRALIRGELQRALEHAQAEAWKRHVRARDARLHVAAIRGVRCRRALDLVGLARQTGLSG